MTPLQQPMNTRQWRWWMFFLMLALMLFAPSLGMSPSVWQDEVQFVDWGRVMLHPHTDWAVTWLAHAQKPLMPISYLGCIGEELAYEVTGTVLGVRLFCIAGGLLAGTFVFTLMKRQGRPSIADGLFAALIVLDPGLMQSYRSGRLDVMAIAFVLGGAVCVQRYAQKQDWRWLVVAAFALGCAPYVWARSIMALPAAVLPLVFATEIPTRKMLRSMFGLIILSAAFGALLLPPAWPGLQQTHDLVDSPILLFRDLAGNNGMKSTDIILRMLEDMLRCILLAVPLLVFAAVGLVAVFKGRKLDLVRKSLVSVVLMATLACQLRFTTDLHPYTAMYLVPLFAMLALLGKERLVSDETTGKRRRWVVAGMSLLLGGHVITTAVKSYNTWLDREAFGPDAMEAVVKALPPSPRRLIVDDFRLYFLLRSHGFQPFYLFADLDKAWHEFRFYAPVAHGDYQPFYLFNKRNIPGQGEVFSADGVPGLLVSQGSASIWSRWAATFEPQLSHPMIKQLPRGARLVLPAP